MKQVLVIDDDRELCELVSNLLESEGFDVETVHDPHGGLQRALSEQHSLVVLDVMLPGMTGFELLRTLRLSSQVPVLMLTARGEGIDRIIGLEMGADDYLPKPFNPRELVARIHAICRRVQSVEKVEKYSPSRIQLDDIVIDVSTRTVKQNNRDIRLTAVEFSLLHELMKHAGKVMERKVLTRKVLGRKFGVFDRSIDVHVSSLRKKLGQMVHDRERIKTVRSVGYMYTLDMKDL